MYPRWCYVGLPDAGQLVALARWRDVLDLIEAGPAALPPATAAPVSLPAP
jgi:hypothetical protein